MRFDELSGRDVVIWGAGREGMAARDELARRGVAATVVVTGSATAPDGVVTGEEALALLADADAIVKSPGIPHTSPEYARLREDGARFTSLMDLWLAENGDRVIAVTGTKGKSTTSALVHHMLTATGATSRLAGNIGIPVGEPVDVDCAVTEVSSYQAAELTASPRVAVVTSLYPEHLPWHGGFDQYVADKLRLVAHGPETIVVPDADGDLARRVREVAREQSRLVSPSSLGITVTDDALVWAGVGQIRLGEIAMNGTHNLHNAALALAAVHEYRGTLDRAAALGSLAGFTPLAHRLETIASSDDRTWIDDGLATAPQAVAAALVSLPAQRIVLIAGGAERDVPFAPLIEALARRDDVDVVAIGPAGARLAAEAEGRFDRIRIARDFADALRRARFVTEPGDVILLSPGAPSFDEFTDYEERSAVFRAAAQSV
ncbi:UDP-N-acetylmuramoylalanine--D-glutamate ligase [Microbacterium faecale]|uniref:UDP-N-acetylmuramoylalanine--D-glutamate ligase n=1 Tax=Microbacterium faecale TaxID=1804630 RepID=A0A916YAI7_9MICO|nr:UDP-N-acetylmuramoyl-L-alanine--D-glutamate ligase [Microbacterium faecale]GGD36782.1 UDP-N-acetylmuramoylalanine--D-glutamate ligase [Microbacterium faecale]